MTDSSDRARYEATAQCAGTILIRCNHPARRHMETFSRRELYELVWTESRLSLAKKLGVSDVWIRKACVRANIPVPPPGYWAREAAGKGSVRPALPPRGFGQNDEVTLGSDPRRYWHGSGADPIEIPPVPVFLETPEVVRARALLALGKCSVPRGFARMAPDIEKLRADEELRRAEVARTPYAWKKPLFDSPAAQRRLKLINALLLIMDRVGCSGRVNREDLSTTLTVADTHVCITLSGKGAAVPRRHDASLNLADPQREALILDAAGGSDLPESICRWSDSSDSALEQQLPQIAVDLLVLAEMRYRAGQLRHRDWLIEQRQRQEAEALRLQREAERKKAEELARIEKARLDHLLGLADRLRKSDEIRVLVAAMCGDEKVSPGLDTWRAWALGVADRLDPRLLTVAEITRGAPGMKLEIDEGSSQNASAEDFDQA